VVIGTNFPICSGLFYEGSKATRYNATMILKLRAFLQNESGATAIEYRLIAAGISVVIIAVVNGIGTKLNRKFTSISTQLK
jgi:pilus assembly protein Flp/PilA